MKVAAGAWIKPQQSWTFAGAACGFLGSAAFAAAGVLALSHLSPGESRASVLLVGIFFAAMSVSPAYLATRALRAGVKVDFHGVEVRGLTRTLRIPLADVHGFAPEAFGVGGLLRRTVGVKLRRRTGHDVVVWALRSGAGSSRPAQEEAKARWRPVCDQLNALVAEMRQS